MEHRVCKLVFPYSDFRSPERLAEILVSQASYRDSVRELGFVVVPLQETV